MRMMLRPTPTVKRVRDDFDRFFNRLFPENLMTETWTPFEGEAGEWIPACDLTETEKEFVVRLEAPGIHKENLDVKLVGDLLSIHGRREMTEESRGETHLWTEREVGTFIRTLRLPAPVIEADIKASFQDGVLTVHLPKVAQAVENKITIK